MNTRIMQLGVTLAIGALVALLVWNYGNFITGDNRDLVVHLSSMVPPTSVIETRRGRVPSMKDFVTVEMAISKRDPEFFNTAKRELYDVTVTGIELRFDPSETDHTLNDLNGRQDLASVALYADRIVLRGRLHLPGTDVTIRAREIVFEDIEGHPQAQLVTTPIAHEAAAAPYNEASKQPGAPGAAGQRAGNLDIFVARVATTALRRGHFLFVLNGSSGQRGGKGRAGVAGRNIRHKRLTKRQSRHIFNNVTYIHYQGTFDVGRAFGTRHNDYGSRTSPDGTDALAGGRPGDGGDGGVMQTTLDLDSLVCDVQDCPRLRQSVLQKAGAPGAPTPGYAGGRAGTPAKWIHLIDDGINSWVNKSGSAKTGQSFPGLQAKPGVSGTLKRVQSEAWLTPGTLRARLEHLRETYLAGHTDRATVLVTAYLRMLAEHGITPGSNPQMEADHNELIVLASRLRNGLDYFGNPPGWAPMLSLPVLYGTYEKQIDESVGTLSLAHWLEHRWSNLDERRHLLGRAIAQEEDAIETYRFEYERALELVPDLQRRHAELKRKVAEFQDRLALKEESIASTFQAQQRLKQVASSALTAMSTGAGLWAFTRGAGKGKDESKGGAGKLIGAATAATFVEGIINRPQSAGTPTAFADSIADRELDAQLDGAWLRFSKLDIIGANSSDYDHQLREISRDMSAGAKRDMEQKAAATIDSDAAADLEALKKADPEFQKLFEETVELVTRKELYALSVQSAFETLDHAALNIGQSRVTIDQLRAARSESEIHAPTRQVIQDMRTHAKERLIQYRYYVTKAYEYRMLEPCPIDYRDSALFDRLAEYFGDEPGELPLASEPALFAELSRIYREDLNNIVAQVIQEFAQHRGQAFVDLASLQLTNDELRRLNDDGSVTIDLGRRIVFDSDRSARIDQIRVNPKSTRISKENSAAMQKLEVTIEPADWSVLRWKDKTFLFKYGLKREVSLAPWGFSWYPPDRLVPFRSSELATETLQAAADLDARARWTFRPGARTEITVRRESIPKGTAPPIEQLGLDVEVHKYKARLDALLGYDVKAKKGQ